MAKTVSQSWEGLAHEFGMDREDIRTYRAAFEHEEMGKAVSLKSTQVPRNVPPPAGALTP